MKRGEAILELRKKLAKKRDELRKALAGDLTMLTTSGQSSGDFVDGALDCAKDEINASLAEVESRELASIELALEKARKGLYGVCEDCKNSIPLARLTALPYAARCINCQRNAEKRGIVDAPQIRLAQISDLPDTDETDLQSLELA